MALGVKRALGILLCLRKNKSQTHRLSLAPYVVIRGQVTSPLSAVPAQRIWLANETMSYDPASATCVCVCVRFRLVQIDVEVEEPETSENLTE